jgi:hypothetical protein
MTKLDKNNAYWGISWKLYLSEDRRMPVCTICSNNLSGRQTKFCSPECKNRDTNIRNQSYRCQQQRGRVRKLELVNAMGGVAENADTEEISLLWSFITSKRSKKHSN